MNTFSLNSIFAPPPLPKRKAFPCSSCSRSFLLSKWKRAADGIPWADLSWHLFFNINEVWQQSQQSHFVSISIRCNSQFRLSKILNTHIFENTFGVVKTIMSNMSQGNLSSHLPSNMAVVNSAQVDCFIVPFRTGTTHNTC